VIVVDDGSTDPGTEDVLAALPAEVVVIRQNNAGLASARNSGLHRAGTPYLVVLDADDRLRPGAINAMRAPLDANPRLGFAYGVTHFFGDWEGELTLPPYNAYKLLYRHMIGSTAVFRHELLDQTGGFDPAFGGYEDWEFWLHALAHGWHGHRVDEVTFDYRRHGSTMINAARSNYHRWYRELRRKHAALYARDRDLARESHVGPVERAVYRWWWGARPLPAPLELFLQSLLWRRGSGHQTGEA
jgi:glycosyltransferase involved in cell wall biosynthesis